MRQKFNYLFIGLLFSGLAFFSYLFLLLYSDFTPQHLEVLISFKSFILILAAFNLVGFGVLMIHNWQKRSFQFLVKRKERLIIDCILTAIILFLMNYLVLSIVKAIFEVPAPFTLKGSGLRMIALVWPGRNGNNQPYFDYQFLQAASSSARKNGTSRREFH